MKELPNGVWPTMVTPYTADNKIEFEALEKMVEWYIANQVDGLFAVCQSSEMFALSLEERVKLAAFVVERCAGRVPVIASGHISNSIEDQIEELQAISATGIDALVLITNRLADEHESDDVFKSNIVKLLAHIPANIPLGLYECPAPYKRLMSPELMSWCAETGRFYFLKDTSCNVEEIREKLKAVSGTGLKIYNANTATLLESLKLGVAGYSGVMANFHPELYVWLVNHYKEHPQIALQLSDLLSMASLIEKQLYPVNAKYYLQLEQVLTNITSRVKEAALFSETNRAEVDQLYRLSKQWKGWIASGM